MSPCSCFYFSRNSGDVLETFNFLENADDSDEEEESDMIEDIAEGKEKHRINKKHKVKYFFKILLCMHKCLFKKGNLFPFFPPDSYKYVMFFIPVLEDSPCHQGFFMQRG